ncbi:hypothetical protein [Pseudomonas aeruginosa]|uniref:hypothetical protein n=1 Tax=Pseudomonas aeruginosa TaxID=287 RepID=UPI000ADBCD5C|nr:hypothetical protein [Pseudomonas aeruginosa]
MSNELTDVRCPCGAEFQADSYDAGFIAGSGMCQNCDAALPPKDICTCPSGDGSLRHPCPAHPAVEQAGGDERAKFEYWASDEGIYPKAVERSGNCYKLAQTQSYWMAWQARAALAEVERLRESKGDPVGSLEKCMKVMYERDEHAKRLEVALARVAEMEKELAMARDAAAKGDAARHAAGGMEMEIQELREKVTELRKELRSRWTYASTQATNCAGCGEHKHTPLRVDWMGGYADLRKSNDPNFAYDDADVDFAYQAWKASRAALRVELPERRDPLNSTGDDENPRSAGFNDCLERVTEALQQAGIEVK